ncbi:LOW QUALITY PROTEIN: hypothetical protein CRUP_000445 [Coryphaenoides rupestris]|nr:LOW QUALITY PROTEIN: hypothetical protein CRUP_000445 [Coryphaenoides rupestris]
MLAASSDYFRGMFTCGMLESRRVQCEARSLAACGTENGALVPVILEAGQLQAPVELDAQMEWRRLGELPDGPRFRHAVGVVRGRLHVVGGCNFYAPNDTMKSAYSYDPALDRWQRLADMQEARSSLSVVVGLGLGGGEPLLYAMGGDRGRDFLSLVQGIMDLQEVLAKMTLKLNYAESRLTQLEGCHCERMCSTNGLLYRDKELWVEPENCRNCACKVPLTCTGSASLEQFAGGQKILRHSTTPFCGQTDREEQEDEEEEEEEETSEQGGEVVAGGVEGSRTPTLQAQLRQFSGSTHSSLSRPLVLHIRSQWQPSSWVSLDSA